MLRPLPLDVLALVLPLTLGALAFGAGRSLRRWPRPWQVAVVTLAVAVIAGGAASFAGLLPDEVDRVVSQLGGGTVLVCWVALFLLGAAWVAPNRRFSTAFLACLAAVAFGLLGIEGSGPLWWRFGARELWRNVPDSEGGLRQSSGLTCSPTAAAMLLARYGIPASEGEMAYLAGTSLFGSDAAGMARALGAKVRPLGWSAHAGHADYAECLRRGQPFVAHVQGQNTGHAVLVEKVSDEWVQIVDPVEGQPRLVPRSEFESIWDGTVVRIDRGGG